MQTEAKFLVLTDLHLAGILRRDDLKTSSIPGLQHPSRVAAADELLAGIADHFRNTGTILDAVIFAGDAQDKGSMGSHEAALDLILRYFEPFGITNGKIVATPGNHDVLKGSSPGSADRYAAFSAVWRDNKCVVPWLDGVDQEASVDTSTHRLVAPDASWAVYPINTSNWSQVRAAVPDALKNVWEALPAAVAKSNTALAAEIRAALGKLLDYDMAHVSDAQLRVLRKTVNETPRPEFFPQVKLAVLHHHLRSPSLRIEVKPFEAITNLEQVRTFLMESGIMGVIHGHKHEHAFRYEYVDTGDPEAPHRVAVLTAGTFDTAKEADAACLVTLKGLPYSPEISVERIGLPRGGLNLTISDPMALTLGDHNRVSGAPILLQGSNFDGLYARATKSAAENPGETIIVHFDPPGSDTGLLKLPVTYPRPESLSDDEMQTWLDDLVAWWQLERSRRDNDFPYPHGSRLRLFGGKLNQIDRVTTLLKKEASSRAFAVLVDPLRDFTPTGENEAFPSFTLMQVRKRESARDQFAVDVTGFYRAQEFSQWWPVNVAELRMLQREIAEELRASIGRITTITTDARFKPQGPGQVAVPIFDRWLDQSPEKLFMLALTLVGDKRDATRQGLLLRDWLRSLDDIERAATASNIDGLLIPAEGMRMLTTYLEMMSPDSTHSMLLQSMRNLLAANREYLQSKRRRLDQQSWANEVRRLVPEIKRLSPAM